MPPPAVRRAKRHRPRGHYELPPEQSPAAAPSPRVTASLLWLRTCLRLHDNPVLRAALAHEACAPVYVFDPADQEPLDLLVGIEPTGRPVRKVGAHRARFLLESLADLQARLQTLGSGIVYRRGRPADVLPVLAKALLDDGAEAVTVYVDDQPGTEEQALFAGVREALEALSQNTGRPCRLAVVWEKTIVHPDDLPISPDECPRRFRDFWAITFGRGAPVAKTEIVRAEVPTPERLPGLPRALHTGRPPDPDAGTLPELADLGYDDEEIARSTRRAYPGGETAALERVRHYGFGTQQLTRYRYTRNRSLGADYSSKWSAYLALGCVSPRRLVREVWRYEAEVKKNDGTYWLVRELMWRDFYQVTALKYPRRMFWVSGKGGRHTDWRRDRETFGRWATGTTGVPFLDAHLRELYRTGFMSNRGRVNASSWLSRDRGVRWTWGAAWFESLLLDYDVASNWLNWQSQATELRPTNPIWQGKKYDARAEYVHHWIPALRALPGPMVHAWFGLSDEELAARGLAPPEGYARPAEVAEEWAWAVGRVLG